jgi:hypothetical protein
VPSPAPVPELSSGCTGRSCCSPARTPGTALSGFRARLSSGRTGRSCGSPSRTPGTALSGSRAGLPQDTAAAVRPERQEQPSPAHVPGFLWTQLRQALPKARNSPLRLPFPDSPGRSCGSPSRTPGTALSRSRAMLPQDTDAAVVPNARNSPLRFTCTDSPGRSCGSRPERQEQPSPAPVPGFPRTQLRQVVPKARNSPLRLTCTASFRPQLRQSGPKARRFPGQKARSFPVLDPAQTRNPAAVPGF